MNKQLIIVGIVVLLLVVGLSGCVKNQSLNPFNEGENTGSQIARLGDTIPEVGNTNNMSMTILSCFESNISVYHSSSYSGGEYHTVTARQGMKFIIMTFEIQNNWIKPQNTPYFSYGNVITNKGYYYPIWGYVKEGNTVRDSTEDEINTYIGDSGGFKELLPEESTLGCIVFEMPENETAVELDIDYIPYRILLD